MASRCLVAQLVALCVSSAVSIAEAQPEQFPGVSTGRPAVRPPAALSRIFVDVNAGNQFVTETFDDSRSDPFFVESATWDADYETRGGPAFDIGGGVRVWRGLIAGASYSRFSDTSIAVINGGVPHPFFFNRTRAIAGEATGLKQQEDAVHITAMWAVPVAQNIDVRIFGGPSVYRLQRDLVEDVVYAEVGYPYDTASFESTNVERVRETSWGFNVGADLTWMLAGNVGLGGTIRYARAEASLASPANDRSLDLQLGGLQIGGGLRFRFGRMSGRRPEHAPAQPVSQEVPEPEVLSREAPEPTTPAEPSPPNDEADAPDSVVLIRQSGVFVRPGVSTPLRVFPAGTRLRVRGHEGEWLIVEFKDPQWGARVGYVLRKDCSQTP